jgi:3'(2'), 5'-bisphosphate nucleotidase
MCAVAREAGAAILQVYGDEDFGVQTKSDDSPLTRADLAAHNIIVEGLQNNLNKDLFILQSRLQALLCNSQQQLLLYSLNIQTSLVIVTLTHQDGCDA